jgi:hypothetical protein
VTYPEFVAHRKQQGADRCTSCGQIRALLDLHELTGQCPACWEHTARTRTPGDHHPILHALMRASYHAFDLGLYGKSEGFTDELTRVRSDLKRNPHAYGRQVHRG